MRRRRFLAAVAATLIGATASAHTQPKPLIVSVASSINDTLQDIAHLYEAETGVVLQLNSAASNTLARQIVEGAPVGVFLSADDAQMDVVEKAGRLVDSTRVALLSNELAVIVPTSPRSSLTLEQLKAGQVNRLAMGDPAAVPAGVYGRKWLEHEGAWSRVEGRVVPFPTVRAVLAAVEAGRVDAGIVYGTDARTSSSVRVLQQIANEPYLNIVQPAAVVKGRSEAEGRRFLQFLQRPQARSIFQRAGFRVP